VPTHRLISPSESNSTIGNNAAKKDNEEVKRGAKIKEKKSSKSSSKEATTSKTGKDKKEKKEKKSSSKKEHNKSSSSNVDLLISNEITNRSENDYNELLSPDNDDTKSIASNSNLSNHDPKEEKKPHNEQDDIDFWLSTAKAPAVAVANNETVQMADEKKEKKKSKKSKSSDKENGTTDHVKSSKHKEKKNEKESKKEKIKTIEEEESKTILAKNNSNNHNDLNVNEVVYKKLVSNKHLKIVSYFLYKISKTL
jgi:hypothetical protein